MSKATSLNILDLERILVLAEAQSFTAAAKQLGVSQPTITRSVLKIERLLGFKIFARKTSQRVATTYKGVAMLNEMEKIIESQNQLFSVASNFTPE